jgi:polyhydroxybutyrate depolymerase
MKAILLFICSFYFTFFVYSQTTVSGTIAHSTGTRAYQLYIPAIYDGSAPVPLVLNLHGYGSSNTQQMFYGDFKSIADTANFLVLAPQGLNDGTGTPHWNANWGTGVDDISFLSDLIDSISSAYNINAGRVYSTGMSNGGFMSFTLAGQLSNKITAVASVTGTMSALQIPQNTVVNPMPIMQIHGTADGTVNYNGDQYFLSVDSVLNYWVAHNNCNPVPTITSVPDINTSDGCTAELYAFTGGDLGAEVLHYKVTNGGHTWPGSSVTIGTTNQDFDASVEIWKFFSQYEKSNLTDVNNRSRADWVELIGGNPMSDVLSLNFNSKQDVFVEIFDLNGKVVLKTSAQGRVSLSTESLERGMYVLRCRSRNLLSYSQKLIKH